jgi:hypothetical protein
MEKRTLISPNHSNHFYRSNNMKIKLLSLLAVFALAACSTPVTQQEIAQAQFPAQPKQAEIDKEVNAYIAKNIPNPGTAQKECAPPRKAWARQNSDKPANFGWMVVCDVNPRDSAGNFTGVKAYMFLFTKTGNIAYDPTTFFTNINNHVQFMDLIGK